MQESCTVVRLRERSGRSTRSWSPTIGEPTLHRTPFASRNHTAPAPSRNREGYGLEIVSRANPFVPAEVEQEWTTIGLINCTEECDNKGERDREKLMNGWGLRAQRENSHITTCIRCGQWTSSYTRAYAGAAWRRRRTLPVPNLYLY